MKNRFTHSRASRGFVLVEAGAALGLVGLLLGIASLLLAEHARTMDYFLDYRRAQLAAESCLERMRVGDIRIADSDFTDATGVDYQIRVGKNDALWEPLLQVQVRAVVGAHKVRPAQYAVSAFLDPGQRSPGGSP